MMKYLILMIAIVLSGCGAESTGGSNETGNTTGAEINGNLIVISEEEADQVVRRQMAWSPSSSAVYPWNEVTKIVYLDKTALNPIAVGDYVLIDKSINTEHGILGKVLKHASGWYPEETSLLLKQVALTDVLKEAEISFSGSLEAPDTSNQPNILDSSFIKGIRVLSLADSLTINGARCQSISTDQGTSIPTFIVDIVNVSLPSELGANSIGASGCIGLSADYEIEIVIKDGKMQKSLFVIKPKEVKEISLSAMKYEGVSSVNLEKTIHTQYLRPIRLMVGDIPVIIAVKLEIVIAANGEVSANISMDGSGSSSSNLRMEYSPASGWGHLQETVTSHSSYNPPTLNSNANINMQAGSKLSFLFYDNVGPAATLNSYLSINADTQNSPWWTFSGGLRAGIEYGSSISESAKNVKFPDILNEEWFNNNAASEYAHVPTPAPPINVNAIASDGKITVSWDSQGTDTYNLYFSSDSGKGKTAEKLTKVTSPFVHTGLLDNSFTYFYTVTANNAGGESLSSTEKKASPVKDCSGMEGVAEPTDDGSAAGFFVEQQTYNILPDCSIQQLSTGLIWQAKDDQVARSKEDAEKYCTELASHSNEDWRLPNYYELLSILSFREIHDPHSNNQFAPSILNMEGSYWSSTEVGTNSWGLSWNYSFNFNEAEIQRREPNNVRCVRNNPDLYTALIAENRFDVSGDRPNETITDNVTGLIWSNHSDLSILFGNYEEAFEHCENVVNEGRSDWRLPSVKELLSLFDISKTTYPYAASVFLIGDYKPYWTSNTVSGGKYGWQFDFAEGYLLNRIKLSGNNFGDEFRCVRSPS